MATEKEPNLQTVPTVQAQFLRSHCNRQPRSLRACRSAGLGPGTFDSERLKVGRAFFPRPPNLPLTAAPRHLTAANGTYRQLSAAIGTIIKLQIKMSTPSAGRYKTTLNKSPPDGKFRPVTFLVLYEPSRKLRRPKPAFPKAQYVGFQAQKTHY